MNEAAKEGTQGYDYARGAFLKRMHIFFYRYWASTSFAYFQNSNIPRYN